MLYLERIKSNIRYKAFRHELAGVGVIMVTLWVFICMKVGRGVLVEVQNHG